MGIVFVLQIGRGSDTKTLTMESADESDLLIGSFYLGRCDEVADQGLDSDYPELVAIVADENDRVRDRFSKTDYVWLGHEPAWGPALDYLLKTGWRLENEDFHVVPEWVLQTVNVSDRIADIGRRVGESHYGPFG